MNGKKARFIRRFANYLFPQAEARADKNGTVRYPKGSARYTYQRLKNVSQ